MAILHGSWVFGVLSRSSASDDGAVFVPPASPPYFFVWGETWRSLPPLRKSKANPTVLDHPYALSPEVLLAFIQQLVEKEALGLTEAILAEFATAPTLNPTPSNQALSSDAIETPTWTLMVLGVPSLITDNIVTPYHASLPPDEDAVLYPVSIPGLALPPEFATPFLQALPLSQGHDEEGMMGDDLRFWSHVGRWSLDLMARGKFVPALAPKDSTTRAVQWLPLLDSAQDQKRFQQFTQTMPLVCRCVQAAEQGTEAIAKGSKIKASQSKTSQSKAPKLDRPAEAGLLLTQAVRSMLDTLVRPCVDEDTQQLVHKLGADLSLGQWVMALSPMKTPMVNSSDSDNLIALVTKWLHPIQPILQQENRFRPCFHLAPPAANKKTWQISYFLQATDDPNLLIGAEMIWKTITDELQFLGRRIERPQETLLVGLGLASRIYPLLEDSLQDARPTGHSLTAMQAYDFIKAIAWRLEDNGFGVIMPPSLSPQNGLASRLGLHVRAETPNTQVKLGLESLLNFKWELAIGGQTLSKAEFEQLVSLDSPLVDINGEWVELRSQDVKAAQTFFANRRQQTGLSLQDALRIQSGDTLTFEKLPVVNFEASGVLEGFLKTLSGNQTFEPIPAPEAFQGTLRPYQERGVGWLSLLEQWGIGACLADDMGLGKTIQLIAFMLHLQAGDRLQGPTLLICPTSVLGNWEREVKRFAPAMKVMLHHGPQRLQGAAFLKQVKTCEMVITSYALAPRDLKTLTKMTWQGVVLDEAQNIKNPETKQTQAICEIQARFRIALTGTPLENRLTELWSILEFLNPGYLGARNFFQRRFATPIERYGDSASLQTLRSLVQPFILRRTKTDRSIIQDLPEKLEMSVYCGLTPEQAALYEKIVNASLSKVELATGIKRSGLILATLVKLKQICNHPAQFLKEGSLSSSKPRSGKLQRLQEMLEELMAEGDRALIFTQFAEMGKLLKAHLETVFKKEIFLLYGATSKQQREEMVDRFQHDPQGPRLFILSLKAGGVGLNLTRANHVFHFDRWWNPAVENQATDRVFRIGQTRNVQVHKFVCTGTLEEKIHEQIESKKALADQVVGGDENWLTKLDTDQLRNLLLLDRSAVIDEDET